MADDRDATWREFRDVVNLAPAELERCLGQDASEDVGATPAGEAKSDGGGPGSVGHRSGRRIVGLRTRRDDLTDDDYAHMRTVVGYVHRHPAQRPEKEPLEDSRWRRSLLNWGHDPLERGGRRAG